MFKCPNALAMLGALASLVGAVAFVMTGHWEFTYGADRVQHVVSNDFKDKIAFVAQNIKTADFGDGVFTPFVIRSMNGVPVAIVGQAFPYTPIAHPRSFVPDWSFGILEENLQCRSSTRRGSRERR